MKEQELQTIQAVLREELAFICQRLDTIGQQLNKIEDYLDQENSRNVHMPLQKTFPQPIDRVTELYQRRHPRTHPLSTTQESPIV